MMATSANPTRVVPHYAQLQQYAISPNTLFTLAVAFMTLVRTRFSSNITYLFVYIIQGNLVYLCVNIFVIVS